MVVDGLYSWSEYKILKEKFKDDLVIIAIYSPSRVRYERLSSRKAVDEKSRFRPLTKEQAQSRDYSEIEHLEKGGPIAMADHTILNIGTIEEVKQQVNGVVK